MIDVHCHLENEDYSEDRDVVIQNCMKEMKGIVTCCAHPKDFTLTMKLVKKYKNFVFCSCSIHPIYVREISSQDVKKYFALLKENKDKIVAIGETGLDYYWVKEEEYREKQKELFLEHIKLAKELGKPLVIHARDSYEECIKILEEEGVEKVDLHMFGGRKLLERVIKNGWNISMNAILLKSKNHKKIIRDMPLDKIMLETDSPWLAPDGGRNTPLTVKTVAEKIAEIKKLTFEEVWHACALNAVKFFKLPIKL